MMLSVDEENTDAVQQILTRLSRTRYACSALTKLSGGSANFVYRGTLLKKISAADEYEYHKSAIETVVIKKSTNFVATNRDFPLDITRCIFEESMLNGLASFRLHSNIIEQTVVRTPRLYFFDKGASMQVLEDLDDTTDLTAVLQSPGGVENILPLSSPIAVGRSLGRWLYSFHEWTSMSEQRLLCAQVGPNRGMRKLKCLMSYDSFIEILDLNLHLENDCRKKLEEVRDTMKFEFERIPVDGERHCGLIHGDFWTGNILLPNTPWQMTQRSDEYLNKLFIIDWENAQFGHRAVDVGGLLADLYERKHFRDIDASLAIMKGFIEGYGKMTDELAFYVAIHTGVHMICWFYRRNRSTPLPCPLPQVLDLLILGRDLVLKGWAKDKESLKKSVLSTLFI